MDELFAALRRRPTQDTARAAKMIVGLGNPGPEYARNRHNIGFQVLELFADRHGLRIDKAQKRARVGSGDVRLPAGETVRVILVKPLTYMNASGEAVGPLAAFYKIAPADILVISDDLDLPAGRLRMRAGGGAGGQKGVLSITQHLHTDAFPRLRLGIGRPPGKMDPADYVLQNFSVQEENEMVFARAKAADAIEAWLASGIEAAMNQFNGKSDETQRVA
jgi:peptidyl-tRNA hydrolase, PTH1 family